MKSIETPLSEITLRRYEKPYNLSKREICAKVCLSLGLLQPGDSRDIIVDIFQALLEAKKERKELSSFEVRERAVASRRELGLELIGVADSNVRRQLKRLRDLFLVEKVKNNYRISEFESLEYIFTQRIEQYVFPTILARVKEYAQTADKNFE